MRSHTDSRPGVDLGRNHTSEPRASRHEAWGQHDRDGGHTGYQATREIQQKYEEALRCIELQKDYIGELEEQVTLLKNRLRATRTVPKPDPNPSSLQEKDRMIEKLLQKNKQLGDELARMDSDFAEMQRELHTLREENQQVALEKQRYREDLYDPVPEKHRNGSADGPNRKRMMREIFDCHGLIAAARKAAVSVVRYAARTSDLFEEADRVLSLVTTIQDKLLWVVSNCLTESELQQLSPQRDDDSIVGVAPYARRAYSRGR